MADSTAWLREPGRGKYALTERERRFRVAAGVTVPPGTAVRLIEDKYLDGLRLRLRRVTREAEVVYKLTQKVRPDESDPSEVLITNMYLSEGEYERLSALSGSVLVKSRAVVATSSHHFVVDEFQGRLQGLRLAEVEVRHLAERIELPAWLGSEVSRDSRFSGGHLAAADECQVRALLDAR